MNEIDFNLICKGAKINNYGIQFEENEIGLMELTSYGDIMSLEYKININTKEINNPLGKYKHI